MTKINTEVVEMVDGIKSHELKTDTNGTPYLHVEFSTFGNDMEINFTLQKLEAIYMNWEGDDSMEPATEIDLSDLKPPDDNED